jgi:hypothetical protein
MEGSVKTIGFTKRYDLEINVILYEQGKIKKVLEMSGFLVEIRESYDIRLSLITVKNIKLCQATQIKSLIKNIKVYD